MLIAVFVLLFMLLHYFLIESGFIEKKNAVRKMAVVTAVCCGLVIGGTLIFAGISATIVPLQPESVDLNSGDAAEELSHLVADGEADVDNNAAGEKEEDVSFEAVAEAAEGFIEEDGKLGLLGRPLPQGMSDWLKHM